MKQNVDKKSILLKDQVGKFEITDFRLYLQNELIERCKKNNAYSLRSFARFLDLDPSTLSQILRGKRKLTKAGITKLANRLGMGPHETARFDGLSPTQVAKSRVAHELTIDAFKVIADWYHYAIFELITVVEFQPNPRWIAKSLGITTSEAHAAIERIQRLGLIEIDAVGKWKQGQDLITTTGNPFTAGAFRKLQKQVLEKAIIALEEISIDDRDQTSMTMAINKKRLPDAKERIKKFRRELCEYLQKDQIRDSVYQLGISLYPLTLTESKKE